MNIKALYIINNLNGLMFFEHNKLNKDAALQLKKQESSYEYSYTLVICLTCFTFSKSGAWKFFSTSHANWAIQLNIDFAPFSSVTSLGKGMRTSNIPFWGDQRRKSSPSRSTQTNFASDTWKTKQCTWPHCKSETEYTACH